MVHTLADRAELRRKQNYKRRKFIYLLMHDKCRKTMSNIR